MDKITHEIVKLTDKRYNDSMKSVETIFNTDATRIINLKTIHSIDILRKEGGKIYGLKLNGTNNIELFNNEDGVPGVFKQLTTLWLNANYYKDDAFIAVCEKSGAITVLKFK